MSALANLRKKVHYETDIPRCGNCMHYRHSMVYLRDSLPRASQILCAKHHFTVRPNAVCDKWLGKDGAVLSPRFVAGPLSFEIARRMVEEHGFGYCMKPWN